MYSKVADDFRDRWQKRPWYDDTVTLPYVVPNPTMPQAWPPQGFPVPAITKDEFDELKKEVLEMKEILKWAKKYDETHNEPDCEMEEKVKIIRAVAAEVGIELDEIPK